MASVYDKYRCHFYMDRFKHILKNIICLFLVSAILLSGLHYDAYAAESWPDGVYVASEGACLIDADSKTVLYGKDEHGAYYPASITKVLTALVVLENCQNLNEQVVFSYDAVHIDEENSTVIGASEGDRLSVLDCLYCLLFQSANEVANALAEHVGAEYPELKENGMSDRDVFVRMMNMKAEELGCTGSHFNNPSGLTDSDHYTTAYDMCLIMAAAIQNDQFLDIERHTYWTHAPIARYPDVNDPWNTVYPKHMMLKKNSCYYYPGTIAGKTGYTMNAGNTLVTAVKKDGMTLVTCVLNAHANHYNDTIRLMDFGFDNFTSLKVTDYDDIDSVIQRDFSIGGTALIDAYTAGIDPETRIVIPKSGSYVEVSKKLDVQSTEKGTNASLIYSYGDRVVGTAAVKLMNIGDMSSYESAAESDSMLARILGMDSTSSDSAGEGSEAETETTQDIETAARSASANTQDTDNASFSKGEGATADTTSDNADSSAASVSTSHERAGEIGRLIGIAIRVFIAAVILLLIFAVSRSMLNKRRAKKREKRRIARMRRSEMLKGEDTDYSYGMQERRLRKTKRKRKR